MFISVDLPAPFSPRSAWTSPGKRSKSIASLATPPGKRFVIDRSSRIGPSLIRSHSMAAREGQTGEPAPLTLPTLLLRGRDDLPGRDQLLDVVHVLDDGGTVLQLCADLAVADATVLDVEHLVEARLEVGRALLELLRRQVDRLRDVLEGARQHLRAEVQLVGVDADPPEPLRLGLVESTESAAAGDGEDDLRLLADLVERDLLALRLVAEGRIVCIAEDDRRLRVRLLHSGSVAAEVADDRRHRVRADRTGDVRTGLLLEAEARHVADEVARLLLLELDPANVRRLRRKIRVVVDVDPGELHVRELRSDLVQRIAHEEARPEDELVPGLRGRLQVRKAFGRRPGVVDTGLESELRLHLQTSRVGGLVEAVVVETADVGDDGHLVGHLRGLPDGRRADHAETRAREHRECERRQDDR